MFCLFQGLEYKVCRSCIQRNLQDNKTYPMCKHPLTEETLTKLPRIVKEMWENLMIQCDYENHGCGELINLDSGLSCQQLWLFTNTLHKRWLC